MFSAFSTFPKIISIEDDIDESISNILDVVSPLLNSPMSLYDHLSQRKRSRRNNDKQFIISITVGEHYQMEDINTEIDGLKLKVSGKCIQTLKNGKNSHNFQREYDLPADVDLTSMKKSLSPSGTFHIVFDKKHIEPKRVLEDISKDDEFRLKVNFYGFKPEEISVKIVGRDVIVEGARKSHPLSESECIYSTCSGYISRTIRMGDEIDMNQLRAKISPDGSIEIFAPKLMDKIQPVERMLPIEK
ncbi:hypothetical protein MXB_4621 [Myxobolus squamalis]|nr:hypothetical protein MXB_4621 [Myxobolus squamalis]